MVLRAGRQAVLYKAYIWQVSRQNVQAGTLVVYASISRQAALVKERDNRKPSKAEALR